MPHAKGIVATTTHPGSPEAIRAPRRVAPRSSQAVISHSVVAGRPHSAGEAIHPAAASGVDDPRLTASVAEEREQLGPFGVVLVRSR